MKSLTYFALLLGILLYACQSNPNQKQTEETGPVKVAAVNYPLTYMARQIATDDFMISFPIPMDVDPAYWEPDNIGLAQFQEAGLILANGAGSERYTYCPF